MPYGRTGKDFSTRAVSSTQARKVRSRGIRNPRRPSYRSMNRARGRNGVRNNLTAQPGQYVNERTGQPYSGPIHMHGGRAMIGATHSSTPHDYLRRTGGNRRTTMSTHSHRTNNGNGVQPLVGDQWGRTGLEDADASPNIRRYRRRRARPSGPRPGWPPR